ncbi:hypothetical protein AHAS_Ahas13G0382700 [Arachis hypogaea]
MVKLRDCSITMAELWALYVVLKVANDLGLEKVEVETDSLCIFQFIHQHSVKHLIGTSLVRGIKVLFAKLWTM